ncbi:MAG: hypothetical protein AAGH40_07890 [Verrucomicrobiota bacterium]
MILGYVSAFGEGVTGPERDSSDAVISSLAEELSQLMLPGLLSIAQSEENRVDIRSAGGALMRLGFARPPANKDSEANLDFSDAVYSRSTTDFDKRFLREIGRGDAGMMGKAELAGAFHAVLAEKASFWEQLDVDGNKQLSEEESSVDIDIDFLVSDLDRDGFLSFAEWLRAAADIEEMKRWSASAGLTLAISAAISRQDSLVTSETLSQELPEISKAPASIPAKNVRHWLFERPYNELMAQTSRLTEGLNEEQSSHKWSAFAAARYDNRVVARYRAAIFQNTLVLEARYEEGWRSYAMDNAIRGRQAAGPDAVFELPTELEVDSRVSLAGDWRQSPPENLSKSELNWFTWGYHDRAYFVCDLEAWPTHGVSLQINAQICNAQTCAIARDLVIDVPGFTNDAPPPGGDTISLIAANPKPVVEPN